MDEGKRSLLAKLRARSSEPSGLPLNCMDYVHAVGSPLDAWLYSEFLWPEFIEINGMIFLSDTVEDAEDIHRIDKALVLYGDDRVRTQRSFNTFPVDEMFGPRTGDTTPREDGFLATKIAGLWKARLRQLFPAWRISVSVEAPDTSSGIAVVFFGEK
jgi:hypothetical protein